MRRFQIGGASFLLLLGVIVCFEARTLQIGQIGRPAPGFFPFWLGLALVMISSTILFEYVREKGKSSSPFIALWKGVSWVKILSLSGVLVLYALFLESLGYIITTFLLLFFLFRVIDSQKWWVVITVSVVASSLTYALFRLWLQVQLPLGLFGI